jgi:hypothetical protein|tara:strand:+ start:556 stop:807 length:252 start_codon:yes stop_codon:yes gene_type:complete
MRLNKDYDHNIIIESYEHCTVLTIDRTYSYTATGENHRTVAIENIPEAIKLVDGLIAVEKEEQRRKKEEKCVSIAQRYLKLVK